MEYSIKKNNGKGEINFTKIKGKIFKILPIYEGKQLNNTVVFDKITAEINLNKYLKKLNLELEGLIYQVEENSKSYYALYDINNIILGLKIVELDHDLVKSSVFRCISILEKLGG